MCCTEFDFVSLVLRQRIPRYQLLLEELSHFTPEFHPEYAVLNTALNKIVDIAEHVNESKVGVAFMRST